MLDFLRHLWPPEHARDKDIQHIMSSERLRTALGRISLQMRSLHTSGRTGDIYREGSVLPERYLRRGNYVRTVEQADERVTIVSDTTKKSEQSLSGIFYDHEAEERQETGSGTAPDSATPDDSPRTIFELHDTETHGLGSVFRVAGNIEKRRQETASPAEQPPETLPPTPQS